MDWDSFWAAYDEAPQHIKTELLEQIDLLRLVKKLSLAQRRLVLRSAPEPIIQSLKLATGLK